MENTTSSLISERSMGGGLTAAAAVIDETWMARSLDLRRISRE